MERAVNDREAAKILGLAIQTLRNWRHNRKGPPYIKLGESVWYQVRDLLEYMENCKIRLDV